MQGGKKSSKKRKEKKREKRYNANRCFVRKIVSPEGEKVFIWKYVTYYPFCGCIVRSIFLFLPKHQFSKVLMYWNISTHIIHWIHWDLLTGFKLGMYLSALLNPRPGPMAKLTNLSMKLSIRHKVKYFPWQLGFCLVWLATKSRGSVSTM